MIDPPRPGLDHRRDDGPDQLEIAGEIDVQRVVPLGVGELPRQRSRREDPLIADDDVDVAEFGHGLGADPPQGAAVADIGLVRHDPAVAVLDEPHRLPQVLRCRHGIRHRVDLRADVQGDDVGALFGEPDGMGAALPTRRSGDERHFPLEPSASVCASASAGAGAASGHRRTPRPVV